MLPTRRCDNFGVYRESKTGIFDPVRTWLAINAAYGSMFGNEQRIPPSVSTEKPKTSNINIDLDAMREVVNRAIRRASAFVRFGLDDLDERDGGDFNLTASIVYNFWPEEITSEFRDAAREEYRAWLVGSCLRELDLFYGLFLDKLWFAIEVGDLHGTSVRSDYMFDPKFARKTNVAAKQSAVAVKLGISDHLSELNSLSLARNALTHHAGVVRSPFDCNNDTRDTLIMQWLAFDMLASRDGEERVVDHAPFDTHTLPGDGPVQIGLRFTPREIVVPAGHQIKLTHPQIAELCMFYKVLCDKTLDGYRSFLREKGILPPGPDEDDAGHDTR
ncbi:hypothetical protein ANTHELSMS3_01685 [Antarctobacter heliothermus]|uniref:Uncharacterized protein n=1 Tax=Antarctobacter heliothermus TaxID=74033 RepID=A0A222E2D2_9RHOB|nr:hypothetical protein ANTHELSMS3_01685 [Antarctobacter heliothermus]